MTSYSSYTTTVVIVTLCESNQKYLITKDPYDANNILYQYNVINYLYIY